MTWRDYEEIIFGIFCQAFPADSVEADVMLPGRFSGIDRQIDVLGRKQVLGKPVLAIADCKYYSDRVDVKGVETVIGLAADVGARIALVVTTEGFSKAAVSRAENEPNLGVHLEVIPVDRDADDAPMLFTDDAVAALMYVGTYGAFVLSPSGWRITPNAGPGDNLAGLDVDVLGFIHPADGDVNDAMRAHVLGWCHMSGDPNSPAWTLGGDLLSKQEENAYLFDPFARVEYWDERVPSVVSGELQVRFRSIDYPSHGYSDVTAFLYLAGGIVFYVVMQAPTEDLDSTTHRARFVIANATFVTLRGSDPEGSHDDWGSLLELMNKASDDEIDGSTPSSTEPDL